jgi:hypothetical protein
MIVMRLDGEEVRRMDLEITRTEPVVILSMHAVNDTTLVVSVGLPPAGFLGDSASDQLIAFFDSRDGATQSRIIGDSRLSSQYVQRVRSAVACGSDENGGFVAVLNRWVFEGVLLDTDATTRLAHFASNVGWYRPLRIQRQWWGSPSLRSVACGGGKALFKIVRRVKSTVDGKFQPTGGYLVVWDIHDRVLVRQQIAATDSVLFGDAIAGTGEWFFLGSSRQYDYPLVHVLRIQPVDGPN